MSERHNHVDKGEKRMVQGNILKQLNAEDKDTRLAALLSVMAGIRVGEIDPPEKTRFVNNHIHTIYSFSPYSPTAAAYMAYQAGLETSGIMDHDTTSGADEYLRAGEIIGMPVTNGFELRVSMKKSPFAELRINNPDQTGVAYTAFHGIPRNRIDEAGRFIAPYRANRNVRNRRMVANINDLLGSYGIHVDFDTDVLPISQSANGGSVTERHLLYATALKMIQAFGRGDKLLHFLTGEMGIKISPKLYGYLADVNNENYAYDLLGVLKSDLVGKIYVPATDECPSVEDYIAACHRVGAIAAYPYLGDVGNSVTGDKKAQTFEDAYLEDLFAYLRDVGYDAITYMPSRNTPEQLARVMALCDRFGFFQISGEDINSPRQSFICKALADPAYAHLYDCTYALIGHELSATRDPGRGMFGDWAKKNYPNMADRVAYFAEVGRKN